MENAFSECKGQCLCGAVKVQANKVSHKVGACHCSMCSKWGGGPFLGLDCHNEVSFNSEENITRYTSSEWAERGFCSICGTHLFYHLKVNGQYIIPVSLFDSTPELAFDHQIFIDEKPSFYDFANNTHNMTGAEVFAAFGAGSD